MRRTWTFVVAGALSASLFLFTLSRSLAGGASVTVNVASPVGSLTTRLSTQIVYPGVIEGTASGQAVLSAYAPPVVRLHAGADGCCWTGGPGPALPEGVTQGSWDFSSLNQMIGNVRAYGAEPVMNIRYAPVWMWTCTTWGGAGDVRDQTFGQFSDYVARLVSYYNTGRMTTETGTVLTNPAGTSQRMTYWELWNEPDLSNETPCHPANWGPALTPAQYLTMWNAVAAKVLAIDSTVKLVGPATSNATTGNSPDYVPTLMTAAHPPDVVSFHGYGGWDNTQTDAFLFDGDASCPQCGLKGLVAGVAQVHAWAPGRPLWLTEMNVNAAYGDDPTGRPWHAYGAAWAGSAFRALALAGVALIHQYQFVESLQFGLVDPTSGGPLLPYWRDYYLSRYFPAGSTLVAASSDTAGIEVLAARPAGSANVRVLIVNRQVGSLTDVGGTGLPASVHVAVPNMSVSQVTMRLLDATTSLTTPALVTLPTASTVTVAFGGYGIALLEFVAGPSSGTPTPTPLPTPAGTPIRSATPSPTPMPSPSASGTPSVSPSATPTLTPTPTPTHKHKHG